LTSTTASSSSTSQAPSSTSTSAPSTHTANSQSPTNGQPQAKSSFPLMEVALAAGIVIAIIAIGSGITRKR
jgi:hypothetical protein